MALPSSLAYEKVFHEEGRFSEDIQNIVEFYQNRKEQIITFYIEKKKVCGRKTTHILQHRSYNFFQVCRQNEALVVSKKAKSSNIGNLSSKYCQEESLK